MDTKITDLPKAETSVTAIAAATPSAPAALKPKKPRKRKRERPMSALTARTIELLRQRAGDDAARDQRDELALQRAFGEGSNEVLDTFDDNGRLDFVARHYLVASGPNRRRILKHPACPAEDEILAYIGSDLAHLMEA